jgi:hypothetical protein
MIATGLTKDDFRILDDGKTRLIDHIVVEGTLNATLNDHKSATAPEALESALPATLLVRRDLWRCLSAMTRTRPGQNPE